MEHCGRSLHFLSVLNSKKEWCDRNKTLCSREREMSTGYPALPGASGWVSLTFDYISRSPQWDQSLNMNPEEGHRSWPCSSLQFGLSPAGAVEGAERTMPSWEHLQHKDPITNPLKTAKVLPSTPADLESSPELTPQWFTGEGFLATAKMKEDDALRAGWGPCWSHPSILFTRSHGPDRVHLL